MRHLTQQQAAHVIELARSLETATMGARSSALLGEALMEYLQESKGDTPPTEYGKASDALILAIDALPSDAQLDLLALHWLGREEFDTFESARAWAVGARQTFPAGYLSGKNRLADDLTRGLRLTMQARSDLAGSGRQ